MYHLLVVPRITTLCTSILSDLGVLGSLDVQEFQLGLIPLEKDLLSLEQDDVYRKLYLVSSQREVFTARELIDLARRADRTTTTHPSTTWAKR